MLALDWYSSTIPLKLGCEYCTKPSDIKWLVLWPPSGRVHRKSAHRPNSSASPSSSAYMDGIRVGLFLESYEIMNVLLLHFVFILQMEMRWQMAKSNRKSKWNQWKKRDENPIKINVKMKNVNMIELNINKSISKMWMHVFQPFGHIIFT